MEDELRTLLDIEIEVELVTDAQGSQAHLEKASQKSCAGIAAGACSSIGARSCVLRARRSLRTHVRTAYFLSAVRD